MWCIIHCWTAAVPGNFPSILRNKLLFLTRQAVVQLQDGNSSSGGRLPFGLSAFSHTAETNEQNHSHFRDNQKGALVENSANVRCFLKVQTPQTWLSRPTPVIMKKIIMEGIEGIDERCKFNVDTRPKLQINDHEWLVRKVEWRNHLTEVPLAASTPRLW